MKEFTGIVDCRIDESLENDFLTLNLWGKPVYEYPIDEMIKFSSSKRVLIISNSDLVTSNIAKTYESKVQFIDNSDYSKIDGNICLVSGRAPFIKCETLKRALDSYETGLLYSVVKSENTDFSSLSNISFLTGINLVARNVFAIFNNSSKQKKVFELNLIESTVINNKNDFELALILKRKEFNAPNLRKQILEKIEEKKSIFQKSNKDGVCLIGHSQIDFWNVESLNNKKVRNCGIAGISSFEYNKDILEKKLLKCSENIYVVMHGTNDIVYETDFSKIIKSIRKTFEYIRKSNKDAEIYFIECININGRVDRSNKVINALNVEFYKNLTDIKLIKTDLLNDEFGLLKKEYTKDGLHLSDKGYEVLKEIVEDAINE